MLAAFAFGALPAVLAALAYAVLASAMPRAGGSYVYASRALGPYWGFVASFAQWLGLSIVIGVVSYLVIPFLRDIVGALGMDGVGRRPRDRLRSAWGCRSLSFGRSCG